MNEARIRWLPAFAAEIRLRPVAASGLALAALAVLTLFAQGLHQALIGASPKAWQYASFGGLAGFGAPAFGAIMAISLRKLSARSEDSLLGFAAGMMLAASSFSLILPGLAAARELTHNGFLASLLVALGLFLGVSLMLGLDRFTPHQHEHQAACGPGRERLNRVWLFVLAITLHNLPEGMAIGVSFSRGDLAIGLPLTSAIAIQDIPEGLAVAMALRAAGLPALRSALLAAASGLMEPLGAFLGVGIANGLAAAYPVGMGRRDDLRRLARSDPRNPPQRPPDPRDPGPHGRLRPHDGARHLAGLEQPRGEVYFAYPLKSLSSPCFQGSPMKQIAIRLE